MAARRLILVMLILLVLSSAVAALIPVERDAAEDSSTTTTTAQEPPPAGKLVRSRLNADSSKPQPIRMHEGDQLELTVTSSKPGSVEILVPGVLEDVDRFRPADIDLLALDRGEYPVRLIPTQPPGARGRLIGRIVVTRAQTGKPAT